jgi:hypothetical protein
MLRSFWRSPCFKYASCLLVLPSAWTLVQERYKGRKEDAQRVPLAAEQVREVEKSSVELLELIAEGSSTPDFVQKVNQ